MMLGSKLMPCALIVRGMHCSLSRDVLVRKFHDFINYDEIELQIEKDTEADNDWIKSSDAMKTMKLGRQEPSNHLLSKSMHEHLVARGYENERGDCGTPNESARRVLSSCLTFPLTLTYAHKLLSPMVPPTLNVLVVGARAESSLPPIWWKDCLYNNSKLHEISIKMTGPGTQIPKDYTTVASNQSETKSLDWKVSPHNVSGVPQTDLTLNENKLHASNQIQNQIPLYPDSLNTDAVPKPMTACRVTISMTYTVNNLKLLHDNEEALQLLQWADVFMLYNPGE